MVRRRHCAALAAASVLVPVWATAQPTSRTHRVGVLDLTDHNEWNEADYREFVAELGRRGYDARNLVIERRFGSLADVVQVRALVSDLVLRKVDVIFTMGGASAGALLARQVTNSVPIVFHSAGDPVATGLVSSLAKPGGNVTGLSEQGGEFYVKTCEYLRDAMGRLSSLAVLTSSFARSLPNFALTLASVTSIGSAMGIRVQFVDVDTPGDFDAAIRRLSDNGVQAADVRQNPVITTTSQAAAIASTFIAYRMPAVGPTSYGFLLTLDTPDGYEARVGAEYVDKILRGAKPADLPVQQAVWELSLNLKTAKALGLNIPQALVLRAAHVIS